MLYKLVRNEEEYRQKEKKRINSLNTTAKSHIRMNIYPLV